MFKACKSLILVLSCALTMPLALADDLLRADHPDRYTVVRGDTLWDIAARFLRTPWRWPDIWYVNPQIANPHLIFTGDVLELVYVDGKPQLQLRRGDLKLSPTARATPWDGAIPTIPIDAIGPFLTRPYVLDQEQLDSAPYIVAFADQQIDFLEHPGRFLFIDVFNLFLHQIERFNRLWQITLLERIFVQFGNAVAHRSDFEQSFTRYAANVETFPAQFMLLNAENTQAHS